MLLRTLNEIFQKATSRGKEQALLTWAGGQWVPVTCDGLYWRTQRLAAWLKSQGVQKGDRVCIISENRWEWVVSDFACLAIGAVDVPLFPALTRESTQTQIADSGSKVVIVSSSDLYGKVASIGFEGPILVMDESERGLSFRDIVAGEEPSTRDAAFDAEVDSIVPDDLATIIYTSGTTGEAKGVMLSHGNLASNITMTSEIFGFKQSDRVISFLPMAHVTARHIDYLFLCGNVTVAHVGRPERLMASMSEIKPTIFVAVPRVYERVRQSVETKAAKAGGVNLSIFQWALKTGGKYANVVAQHEQPPSLLWKLANKLVYRKIAQAFGGSVRLFVSGGAPLGIDLARWFASMGVPILEGYGLTETSPVIAVNREGRNKLGSIGQKLENLKIRFAEDGELEVRGPSVFLGYWKKPQETVNVMEDGWFHTGDIGYMDEQGFISITDRKRELIKTIGGKFVAPQPIENRLKVSPLIGCVALQGDQRKYVSAIVSPNFSALEEWARDRGIGTEDRLKLIRDSQVIARFQKEFDRVNQEASPWEKVKRFRLVPEEWSVESGEFTPSLKLKRRVVSTNYAREIEAIYHGNEAD